MANSGDTAMVSTKAANPPFKTVTCLSKSKRLKVTPVQKEVVERMHSFLICTYFPNPSDNMTFNPVMNMCALMTELIKYKPSLVVMNVSNNTNIVLATDPFPTNKVEFKKFFTFLTDMCMMTKSPISALAANFQAREC